MKFTKQQFEAACERSSSAFKLNQAIFEGAREFTAKNIISVKKGESPQNGLIEGMYPLLAISCKGLNTSVPIGDVIVVKGSATNGGIAAFKMMGLLMEEGDQLSFTSKTIQFSSIVVDGKKLLIKIDNNDTTNNTTKAPTEGKK